MIGRINQFLASPDARLQLPPELAAAANARLTAAQFAIVNGRQVLEVKGTLEVPAAMLKRLTNR